MKKDPRARASKWWDGEETCENYSTIWMIPKWKPRTRQRRRVRRVKCLIWEEILTILLLENFFTQASASSSCRLHFQKVLSFLFFPSSAWVSSDLLSSDNTHRQCGTQEEREIIITMMSTKKGGRSGWNFSFSFFFFLLFHWGLRSSSSSHLREHSQWNVKESRQRPEINIKNFTIRTTCCSFNI